MLDNNDQRLAYRLGCSAVRAGNVKADVFLPNPYDFESEPDLFAYWELGFEDAYAEELEMLNLLDDFDELT
jgi:hypothetical protein